MDIQVSSNSVTITGNIKSVSDYQNIKTAVDSVVSNHNTLILNITDSLSITSSVIGYFNKLVLKDSIDLHMNVGNPQLSELIEDLSLTSVFKVKKV